MRKKRKYLQLSKKKRTFAEKIYSTLQTMFTRTIQLLGENGFQALQDARVILFGVGGVGGWCAEALLRTGIGRLTIVDFDKVDTTNLNRQVVATHDNIGLSKVL